MIKTHLSGTSQTLPVLRELDSVPPKQVMLSEPQRLAMEWLMGGGSVTEAGQYAGVCRQTVSDWLNNDEDFRALFLKWKEQVQTMTQARLIALTETALDTVASALREKHDARVALAILKGTGAFT